METAQFLEGLVEDIQHNRVVLPTLPEVANKVRETVEDHNADASEITRIISADAALAARMLQVANSPLMRGRSEITDLKMAVTRLGNKLVRNLVTSLVMEQLYHSKSAILKKYMRKVWLHSTQVAAISYVFADRYTKLEPDQAMLAGLVHDIGALPIIKRFEQNMQLLKQDGFLEKTVFDHHITIGRAIMELWNFPEDLITVVVEHESLERYHSDDVDYADVVMIANLHSYMGSDHPYTKLNWTSIPAFKKLGLTPKESIEALEKARDDVAELQKLVTS
ncbi:MAG: HDOD domain-containing protein [Gammaproteobacteria bacterium]|nr:HDOD domain-containing protein [Gammaproteobacteria bacterium]MDH5593698.1 HDOD domain-containing protein [Gammaproteobacteria bacterium]MDH5614619.1 HDOD domain-containing protein [Gammaproteobacteria bacterium]